jgi:hypothetical protein
MFRDFSKERSINHNHIKVVSNLYVTTEFTFKIHILTSLYFLCVYVIITIKDEYFPNPY